MCNFAKTKFQVSAISLYGNRHKIYGSSFYRTFFKRTENQRKQAATEKEGNVPDNNVRLNCYWLKLSITFLVISNKDSTFYIVLS